MRFRSLLRWAVVLGLAFGFASPVRAQFTLSGGGTFSGALSLGPGTAPSACPDITVTPLSFAGTQGADCMRTIYHPTTWDKRGDISYGLSDQEPKLTTDCNVSGCGNIPVNVAGFPVNGKSTAVVIRAISNITNAWIAANDPAPVGTVLRGDGETCIDGITSEINGEKCTGVSVLITEGSNQVSGACGAADGGAYLFAACNAKNTGTNKLSRVNLCTGVVTQLAMTSLNTCADYNTTTPLNHTCLDNYGGTLPPANADKNRDQEDWHEYALWVQTCLRVQQVGTAITLTGRTWRIGKASGWVRGDVENNDPGAPGGVTTYTRYLVGTTVFSGTRAANINATGFVGIGGQAASQSTQGAGMTNLRFSTTPQP